MTNSFRFSGVDNMAVIFCVPKFHPPTLRTTFRLGFVFFKSFTRLYLSEYSILKRSFLLPCVYLASASETVFKMYQNKLSVSIRHCQFGGSPWQVGNEAKMPFIGDPQHYAIQLFTAILVNHHCSTYIPLSPSSFHSYGASLFPLIVAKA